MLSLAHAGTAVASAFLASLVEAVEALTIVLAVGTVRGWRPALAGTLAGLAFLAALVLAFGPLIARMPIHYMQLAVGVLLLLFGMRWLRKAILRAAGVIAPHDEAEAFAEESATLRAAHGPRRGWDAIAVITAFKAVVLEGLEVVFIVLAVGAAGGLLVPASLGALAACALVIYSVAVPGSTAADILKELAPAAGELVLPPLGPDKFINSDLEKILKGKGIKTVVALGTQAQTSVLHTGAAAALRGFKVIVPVDGMSSDDVFPELYTAWHLANAARISAQVTLTRLDMIGY